MAQKGCGWEHKFRGCGYRVTIPRQAVLDKLSCSSKHLCAEDIYISIHKKYPGVGLTTVYRTLDLLINMGLVHRFDFGDGKTRYELTEGKNKEHHHHLVCTECGRIVDYNDFVDEELEFLKRAETNLSKKHKFNIKSHQIHFYGLCNSCSKGK